MFNSRNWLNYALSRPMANKPFTEFKYNSGCPMIVAGIIEKATKMKLDEFAKKYLFDPLGIVKFRWQKYKLIIAFSERNYTTPEVSPIFIKESILPLLK